MKRKKAAQREVEIANTSEQAQVQTGSVNAAGSSNASSSEEIAKRRTIKKGAGLHVPRLQPQQLLVIVRSELSSGLE